MTLKSQLKDELKDIGEFISSEIGTDILSWELLHSELILIVEAQAISRVLSYLRDSEDLRFSLLMDVCGVDYLARDPRFDVVYNLLSLKHNCRIRVKCQIPEGVPVPSVSAVFSSAGWWERETFDLFGIPFENHPDLRRILTDYGFVGHPLRKDFPLSGYVEVRYDEAQKRVVYEPVELPQAFRNFDFESPWEGVHDVVERTHSPLPGDEKAVA
ncbi:NADH-quinone oxidoreductase subunit C [Candidatus Bealeia paramacronuclearis]|uniref:NADH-quinone oxidoreductase subunit C n=2 Tax=Candidatus Bealeia paramacronuclearis TaxID=1921001 RepID=A0ABZ2C4X7_9PROT|nr:NADH-quinone oxidoreductase subunit C [Candidatus Bealeia paramacronuclearis]